MRRPQWRVATGDWPIYLEIHDLTYPRLGKIWLYI